MRNYRPGGFRVTTEGNEMKAATKKVEVNHALAAWDKHNAPAPRQETLL